MAPTVPRAVAMPLMAMMAGKSPPAGRLQTGLARKDPYGCYVSCSTMGFCPPKADPAFLQLGDAPTIPATPAAPAPRAGPLSPATPQGSMGFAFPMLMFMGAKKQRAVGSASTAQFSSCMQTCAAQQGCNSPPDLGT
tara:strand:+ start:258 stop:668 length:411 start_codon:yes stop_codon:yes gene_type:complete